MVRMRGLEPPRDCSHMDLNHARLPIPPHPQICHKCDTKLLTTTSNWRILQ